MLSPFSALLRAENSEIRFKDLILDSQRRLSVLFCEPKIPKLVRQRGTGRVVQAFSALLRAENSEITKLLE